MLAPHLALQISTRRRLCLGDTFWTKLATQKTGLLELLQPGVLRSSQGMTWTRPPGILDGL